MARLSLALVLALAALALAALPTARATITVFAFYASDNDLQCAQMNNLLVRRAPQSADPGPVRRPSRCADAMSCADVMRWFLFIAATGARLRRHQRD
jgi:hypothetical protein